METHIYNNSERNLILPYIIAPLGELQDTTIIGPSIIKEESESHFIEELNGDISVGSMFARTVKYKDFLNMYVTFSTDCKEKDTDRTGLKITIGLLIKYEILEKINLKGLFEYFINKINSSFDIDIFNSGAAQFIYNLNDNNLCLEKQSLLLCSFFSDLHMIFQRKSKKRTLSLLSKKRTNKQTKFPSLIFVPEQMGREQSLERILLFFEIVDNHIGHLCDVSTFEGKGKYLHIIPCLPCLSSEKVKKVSYKGDILEVFTK